MLGRIVPLQTFVIAHFMRPGLANNLGIAAAPVIQGVPAVSPSLHTTDILVKQVVVKAVMLFPGRQHTWATVNPLHFRDLPSEHRPPTLLQKTLGCPGSQPAYNFKVLSLYTFPDWTSLLLLSSAKMKNN